MMLRTESVEAVIRAIGADELVHLALDLGNIPSPYGQEKAAADFAFDWLSREGFAPRRVAMVEDRPNVVGALPGRGGGPSILFTSHLDTGRSPSDPWVLRDPSKRFYTSAWLTEDGIMGHSVENDKGPMACFMIAAKALRQSGADLLGDMILTMCPGEIGQEPVDEFQGVRYLSKEVGLRYLLTHGGIHSDFGIAAEGTDFGVAWVEAGKAFFKVTVYGTAIYTPWVQHPERLEESSNAIVRMARVIEALEAWAREYERRMTRELSGGTIVPKAQIGAIRGGYPHYLIVGTEVCSIYLDVRTVPGQDPRVINEELVAILDRLQIEGRVEMFLHRPSAESSGVEPLVGAVDRAHRRIFGGAVSRAIAPFASMWRDNIVLAEFGISAVTYGPPRFTPIKIEDLVRTAQSYALITLDLCSTPRSEFARGATR